MRNSLARSQRRDIRRAMGPSVVAAMDTQDQTVATLAASLNGLQRTFALHRQELAERATDDAERFSALEASLRGTDKRIDAHVAASAAFFTRGFWERLRWLMLGR